MTHTVDAEALSGLGDPPRGLDIEPAHWQIVQLILHRHVLQHPVWAIGSWVKGGARRYSDLDLAVVTEIPLPWATYGALKEAFSESDLPWKVDVLDWSTTSPAVRERIRVQYIVLKPGEEDRNR